MCLIAWAWRVHPEAPLVLLANRDEFRQRPWLPAHHWGQPLMQAGRDLQAGGTWLGLSQDGRFAALTNVRKPGVPAGKRSRGEWVQRALASPSTADLLAKLQADSDHYAGFNLLFGSAQALYCWHSPNRQLHTLAPGVHALSNADLDTPWPKVAAARRQLGFTLTDSGLERESLWSVMADPAIPPGSLPDTGVGPDWERRLAPALITGPDYGTLSRNLLIWFADGRVEFNERIVD